MQSLLPYLPLKGLLSSSDGFFDPATGSLKNQIEKKVVSPLLILSKATLLSILPALKQARSHKEITLSLARQSAEIVIRISRLIDTAEETPALLGCISQLELTLKSIYEFINSQTQENTISLIFCGDEMSLRCSALKEQLTTLLDNFKIDSTPHRSRYDQAPLFVVERRLTYYRQRSAPQPPFHPNGHESVTFFRNASHCTVKGSRFYNANGNIIFNQETSKGRLEKMEENIRAVMEGNTQAVKAFIQTTISQQISSVFMGTITLIDATGQKHPILMNMAGSFEQFNETLKVLFRPEIAQGKLQRQYLDKGEYNLSIDNGMEGLEITNQEMWSNVEPGVTIVMSIVLVQPIGRIRQYRCPICKFWNFLRVKADITVSVDCQGCQRRLQIPNAKLLDRIVGRQKEADIIATPQDQLELIRNIQIKEYRGGDRETVQSFKEKIASLFNLSRRPT